MIRSAAQGLLQSTPATALAFAFMAVSIDILMAAYDKPWVRHLAKSHNT
jgi:hypothetical protein